jgi:hypothetical protein
MSVEQRTRSQTMQRAKVDPDGTEVEFENVGSASGDSVVLIQGAFLASAYSPLCAAPLLANPDS